MNKLEKIPVGLNSTMLEHLLTIKAGLHKTLITEFLSRPRSGIVTIRTWWSDGSFTEREVYKYSPVLSIIIEG